MEVPVLVSLSISAATCLLYDHRVWETRAEGCHAKWQGHYGFNTATERRSFLIYALDRCDRLASRPGHVTLKKSSPVPTEQKTAWAPEAVWRPCREDRNCFSCRASERFSALPSPKPSLYGSTEWATAAQKCVLATRSIMQMSQAVPKFFSKSHETSDRHCSS